MSAGVGLLLDRALGEPPTALHPVVLLGRLLTDVERRRYRDSKLAGIGHAAVGTAAGVAAGAALGSPALAAWLASSGRMLGRSAREIGAALERDDLVEARRLLPALVGRDPSTLDEAGIARAVVESVAENAVDAVVAPAIWAAVAGAPGAFAHRAVNTMDAMIGHRSPRYARYGWAAARLDDAMAWLPARATAALVAAVRPAAAGAVWRAVRDDAPAHPSPNAGVAEAAFAAALGLHLGGPVRYGDRDELRPLLGSGRAPVPADIPRAVALLDHVTLALAALLLPNWRRRGR